MKPQSFYLQSKNPDDLSHFQKRNKADFLIEVVPYRRPRFDFISFIEFSNIISNDYDFSQITKCKDGACIELYKKNFKLPAYHNVMFQFKIVLGNNFDFIRVFVKHFMNEFDYEEKSALSLF